MPTPVVHSFPGPRMILAVWGRIPVSRMFFYTVVPFHIRKQLMELLH